jgi:hypothetical protein
MQVLVKDLNNGYESLRELISSPTRQGISVEQKLYFNYRLARIYKSAREALDNFNLRQQELARHYGLDLRPGAHNPPTNVEAFNRDMLTLVSKERIEISGDPFSLNELADFIQIEDLSPRILGDLLGWLIADQP